MPPVHSTAEIPDWDKILTPNTPPPISVPIAAWVCIGIGAYAFVIALILIIRQCVLSKGVCGECRFNCCEGSCNQWCIEACQASCDCKSPSVTGCLDAVCPQRRNVNVADIVTCRCCADQCACCDDGCSCGDCNCNFNCDCENINCLCCECKLSGNDSPAAGQQMV